MDPNCGVVGAPRPNSRETGARTLVPGSATGSALLPVPAQTERPARAQLSSLRSASSLVVVVERWKLRCS